MRDYVTVGNTKDAILKKLEEIRLTINKQREYEERGALRERVRILQILSSISMDESDNGELRLKIVMDLMKELM
jgi:hypothetical protein